MQQEAPAAPEAPLPEARAPSALGAGAGAPAADGVYDLGFTPSSAGKHKVKAEKKKSDKKDTAKTGSAKDEHGRQCVIC